MYPNHSTLWTFISEQGCQHNYIYTTRTHAHTYIHPICWKHLQGMIFHVYKTPFPTMLHFWAKRIYTLAYTVNHTLFQ